MGGSKETNSDTHMFLWEKNSRWLEFLNHPGTLYVLYVRLKDSSSKSVQLEVAGILLRILGRCRGLGPTQFKIIVRYFPLNDSSKAPKQATTLQPSAQGKPLPFFFFFGFA